MPDNLPKDPLKPLCYFKLGPEGPSFGAAPVLECPAQTRQGTPGQRLALAFVVRSRCRNRGRLRRVPA